MEKGQEIDLIDREKLKEEIADVFAYAILLAGSYGFDVSEIVSQKIKKNAQKYPVEEFRGSAKKYTELNEIRDKKLADVDYLAPNNPIMQTALIFAENEKYIHKGENPKLTIGI